MGSQAAVGCRQHLQVFLSQLPGMVGLVYQLYQLWEDISFYIREGIPQEEPQKRRVLHKRENLFKGLKGLMPFSTGPSVLCQQKSAGP